MSLISKTLLILCAVIAPGWSQKVDPAIEAAVSAADRSDADKKMDDIRQPAKMMAFFGLKPGMKVAELGGGQGYTSELAARVVGEKGHVYLQNPPQWSGFVKAGLDKRMAKPVMANVTSVTRAFGDPLPAEAVSLDMALCVLIYHDVAFMPVDRAEMNKNIFKALKPGGVYAVVDHHAKKGAGVSVARGIHRIEASVVRAEIEAAGFEFVGEADFLSYPDDTRDFMAWGRPVQPRTDRFVYKFRKPAN